MKEKSILYGILMVLIISIGINIYSVIKVDKKSETTETKKEYMVLADKILNREVIEDSYLLYIDDEQLKQNLVEYNEKSVELNLIYSNYAMFIVIDLCQLTDEDGELISTSAINYDKIPDNAKHLITKISKYCLYENATELIYGDRDIALIICGELGGSYGNWPLHLRAAGDASNAEYYAKEFDEYILLVNSLLMELNEVY